MVYQAKVISKQKIGNIEDLNNVFGKESPIPGFVLFEAMPNSDIYLKKTQFELEILAQIGDNYEDEEFKSKIGKFVSKNQTIFFTRKDKKTFKFPFENGKRIRQILSERLSVSETKGPEKIIIVSKYKWKNTVDGEILHTPVTITEFVDIN